jgi:ArsR family transcriptional regulator
MNDCSEGEGTVAIEMPDVPELAAIAKALGHPARVQIVRLLAEQDECRGSEVFSELSLAQSTVSEHLRVLREADVVRAHPLGNQMVYCLHVETLEVLTSALEAIASTHPECEPEESA